MGARGAGPAFHPGRARPSGAAPARGVPVAGRQGRLRHRRRPAAHRGGGVPGPASRRGGGGPGLPALRRAARQAPAGRAAAGLEVSVTHSGRRVGLAVATAGAVGLDVEQVESPQAFPYDAALTPAELTGLRAVPPGERDRAFITAWARKEAVLKAAGIGLRLDPRRFAVAPAGRPAWLLDWPADAPPLRPGARLYDATRAPGTPPRWPCSPPRRSG